MRISKVSSLWLLAFPILILVVAAFWKPYVSQMARADRFSHAHAATMSAWCVLLVVQGLWIRSGRRQAHRIAGRLSYGLVPLILAAAVALAHHRLRPSTGEVTPAQAELLFVQLGTSLVFLLAYALAIVYRRSPELHARYMIGTGLTMIDPVVARILFFYLPAWAFLGEFVVYLVTAPVLLALIVIERRQPRGRAAFPVMLGIFLVYQTAATNAGGWEWWREFAQWLAGLSLT